MHLPLGPNAHEATRRNSAAGDVGSPHFFFCSPGEPLVVSVARILSSDYPIASVPHHPYSPELVALELLAKSVGLDDIRREQVVEDGSELLLESDRRASGCPWQGWRY